jgi:hypothetical protein
MRLTLSLVIKTAILGSLLLAMCLVAVPDTAQQQEPSSPPPPVTDNLPPEPSISGPPAVNPQFAAPQPAPAPSELTIPAGTFLTVRLTGTLSSDINQQGDGFAATLEQPIVVNGWVVARRGQLAIGHVVEVQKAGRVKGVSSLGVALTEVTLVDGRQTSASSQLVRTSAGSSKGLDAIAVVSTTGLGAAIGGAVDGGAGAGIGAAAGAAAGLIGVLLTPGRPTVMPAESLLTFRLQSPITVKTEKSAVAFLPVLPQDYADATPPPPQLQARPVAPPYPPGPAYPYPYPNPYPYAVAPYWAPWGFYPSVSFVGYYGGRGCCYGGHWH